MFPMQLHDIFPAIDTTGYLVMFGAMALCLALLLLFLFWKWHKRKKKKTRPYYLNILRQYDFNDSKRTTNQLNYYGKFVIRTPQEKEKLQYLVDRLTPYRYQKESIPIAPKTQKEIRSFLVQLGAKDV